MSINVNVRFVRTSSNRKTGPIPVTSTSANSCAHACPLNQDESGEVLTANGKLPKCYAGFGNTAIHWRKLNDSKANGKNILDWEGLAANIKALPKNTLWRMNEAGDLPHNGNGYTIDKKMLGVLVSANKGRNGFTYTHHPASAENIKHIRRANNAGFTINLSANNTSQAAQYVKRYSLPTVTLLPVDAPNVQTVEGVKVVACPAEKSDKVACSNCKLCAISSRDYVIGFRAHGTAKKLADKIASSALASDVQIIAKG